MPRSSPDSIALLSAEQADPTGLLRSALVQEQGFSAREVLLAWLMSLAPGVDPASAARAMLPQGERLPGTLPGELAEIARWPSERLEAYARPRRRRPGWCPA
ncbi:hypothetical protein [Geminicoccus roseus]|uniref:hypothetical protein n=1 Tax=Geminicoccus roseus TaxID=404900 RepID=UPI00041C8A35|nr:hypothetical protein [Geminicoccus roseus]